MPKFQDDDMDTHAIGGSNFAFSAAKIGNLGASEYTLGLVAVDVSGSTSGFTPQMEKVLQEIIKACRKNPRADNMMIRIVMFNSTLSEFHGFKLLPNCNEADYVGSCHATGYTALYDAVYEGVMSCVQYAKELAKQDYTVNAAVFVITDGEENASKVSVKMVHDAFEEATKSEALESLMSVLIGVNTSQGGLNSYLDSFKRDAGFMQYVGIDDASEANLAKLGGFISQSISSQSRALGTGGVSASLNF